MDNNTFFEFKKQDISVLNEVKNIMGKYDIKLFKITKTTTFYERYNGLMGYISDIGDTNIKRKNSQLNAQNKKLKIMDNESEENESDEENELALSDSNSSNKEDMTRDHIGAVTEDIIENFDKDNVDTENADENDESAEHENVDKDNVDTENADENDESAEHENVDKDNVDTENADENDESAEHENVDKDNVDTENTEENDESAEHENVDKDNVENTDTIISRNLLYAESNITNEFESIINDNTMLDYNAISIIINNMHYLNLYYGNVTNSDGALHGNNRLMDSIDYLGSNTLMDGIDLGSNTLMDGIDNLGYNTLMDGVDDLRSNSLMDGIENLEFNTVDSKKMKKIKDLKDAILTLKNVEHRKYENLVYKDNSSLSNIFENCITAEIRFGVSNCELLEFYYKTGAFLSKLREIVEGELSGLHDNNIVSGILKGSGIIRALINKYGDYNESVKNRARRLYNISIRVYKVYKSFPYAIAQIFRAVDVSGDKLLRIGNKMEFERFAEEIKSEVDRNCESYNTINSYSYVPGDNTINFDLITNEIKNNIIKFAINPNLSLEHPDYEEHTENMDIDLPWINEA